MSLGIPSCFGAYVGPFVESRIFYNTQITESRNRRVQPMGKKQSLSVRWTPKFRQPAKVHPAP